MKVPRIGDINHKAIAILFIASLFLAFFTAGCGEEYSSTSDTGSYTCTLTWPEDVPILETASRSSKAIDCDAAGIVTVAFHFYDRNGIYLAGDGWLCSSHEGTVHGIPAGTNRRLEATAKDSWGTVHYRGEKTGITITAGQTTQGGEIEMQWLDPTPPR